MKTNTRNYVPDTSQAEFWETEDIFIWHGMKFRVLPRGKVVPYRNNSKGKGAKHDDK